MLLSNQLIGPFGISEKSIPFVKDLLIKNQRDKFIYLSIFNRSILIGILLWMVTKKKRLESKSGY
jgi:hypothetical protein